MDNDKALVKIETRRLTVAEVQAVTNPSGLVKAQRPDRVYDDMGNVAVLYSPGYGAGWSTWNTQHPECVFEPRIVELVRAGASAQEIAAVAEELWGQGDDYFYAGGAGDLTIRWLPPNVIFRVEEYDGSESVVTPIEHDWFMT